MKRMAFVCDEPKSCIDCFVRDICHGNDKEKRPADCPLVKMSDFEEAQEILSKVADRELYIWDALNKLGFKKGA